MYKKVLIIAGAALLLLIIAFLVISIASMAPYQKQAGHPLDKHEEVNVPLIADNDLGYINEVKKYAETYRDNAELVGVDIRLYGESAFLYDYKFYVKRMDEALPEGTIVLRVDMGQMAIVHVDISYVDDELSYQTIAPEQAAQVIELIKKEHHGLIQYDSIWYKYRNHEFELSFWATEAEISVYKTDSAQDISRVGLESIRYSIDPSTQDSSTYVLNYLSK